jgi:Ca2+-binding RTX toxin-like protein
MRGGGRTVSWFINFNTDTAEIATSTTWAFQNAGLGSRADVYFRGTGFSYDTAGRLQSGQITTIEHYAREARIDGAYLTFDPPPLTQRISFTTPVDASLLHDYLSQVAAFKATAGFALPNGPLGELTSVSPTQLVYTGWDGGTTFIVGSGFDGSWNGTVVGISSSRGSVSGLNVPKYIVDAAAASTPDWQFPLLTLGGSGATITNFDSPASNDVGLLNTAGNDTVSGVPDGTSAAPFDEVSYWSSNAPVSVDLAAGTATGYGTDTLIRIEEAIGSQLGDTLLGSAVSNYLYGAGGNDRIDGRDGDDRLWGGSGNDTVLGGAGRDTIGGEAGNDSLQGGADNDILQGGKGIDTIDGGNGIDIVRYDYESVLSNQVSMPGVTVSLSITGEQTIAPGDSDTLNSIEGLIGSYKSDTLTGTNGDNVIAALHGNDSVLGGAGNDSIDGGPGRDTIDGGSGDDLIEGLDDNDSIRGGAGNDTLIGSGGHDTIDGGAGTDVASYSGVRANYQVTVTGNGSATVLDLRTTGTDGMDWLTNVEILQFSDGSTAIGTYQPPVSPPSMSFSSSSISIPEDAPIVPGTWMTVADVTLVNPGNAALNFSHGGDADRFVISPTMTGAVLNFIVPALDFETKPTYTYTISVDDPTIGPLGSIEAIGSFTVNVIDVDETPVTNTAPSSISFLAAPIAEDIPPGTLVGSVSGIDPDAGDTLTFHLTNDAGGRFRLDGAHIIATGAPGLDYETATSHQIEITATDTGGLSLEQIFSIAVTDVPEGPPPPTIITGSRGNDAIEGTDGDDVIDAGAGNDTAHGGGGNDTLRGEAGNDHLFGDEGSDELVGGAGNDTYVLDQLLDLGLDDSIIEVGGGGIDTVRLLADEWVHFSLAENVENLIVTGDVLLGHYVGNALSNSITGTASMEIIDGGIGADTMVGGAGSDSYYVDSLLDRVVETGSDDRDAIYTDLSSYSLARIANIEILEYTGTGDFIGTGNALNNDIYGGAGDDTLTGGAGSDWLEGRAGADLYIVDMHDMVSEGAEDDGAIDTVRSSGSWMLDDVRIENLELTGGAHTFGIGNASNNVITGNDGGNLLLGGGGDDTLSGGRGHDTLEGEIGIDHLAGGLGNDTYVIDADDIVTEAIGEGTDTIVTAMAHFDLATLPGVENLGYIGIGSFTGLGNAGRNSIVGGEGDDSLDGAGGSDTLVGGRGNDTYVIDNAADKIVEDDGGGDDAAYARVSTRLAANVENLVLLDGATVGTGNAISNVIIGNSSANKLDGGAGDDSLFGAGGTDSLFGALGDDAIIVDAGTFAVVNGGAGEDGLLLVGGTVLDLTAMANTAVTGIEYFDMISLPGPGSALTLGIDDVRALSGTTSLHALAAAAAGGGALAAPIDAIAILGDAGDTVRLAAGTGSYAGGNWLEQATASGDVAIYDYWLNGTVRGSVIVDGDVDVII